MCVLYTRNMNFMNSSIKLIKCYFSAQVKLNMHRLQTLEEEEIDSISPDNHKMTITSAENDE